MLSDAWKPEFISYSEVIRQNPQAIALGAITDNIERPIWMIFGALRKGSQQQIEALLWLQPAHADYLVPRRWNSRVRLQEFIRNRVRNYVDTILCDDCTGPPGNF